MIPLSRSKWGCRPGEPWRARPPRMLGSSRPGQGIHLHSPWLWAVVIRKGRWALLPLSAPLSALRWLSYLLLFILDLLICLIACLGLAKRSRCLLAS